MNPVLNFKEAFVVPGESNIIDGIHPETGLSIWAGETLEQIQQRYPGAIRVNFADWMKSKIERQNKPLTWYETDKGEYYRMFECLPPAGMGRGMFLVGEASDHCAATGRPRYQAYKAVYGKFYRASRPMTALEFNKLKEGD